MPKKAFSIFSRRYSESPNPPTRIIRLFTLAQKQTTGEIDLKLLPYINYTAFCVLGVIHLLTNKTDDLIHDWVK